VRYLPDKTKLVIELNKDFGFRAKWYGDNGYSTLRYLLVIELPKISAYLGIYRTAPACGIRNTR